MSQIWFGWNAVFVRFTVPGATRGSDESHLFLACVVLVCEAGVTHFPAETVQSQLRLLLSESGGIEPRSAKCLRLACTCIKQLSYRGVFGLFWNTCTLHSTIYIERP